MRRVLPLLLLAACQDYSLNKYDEAVFGDPMIDVSPLRLEFGGLAAGEKGVQSFTVTNVGDGYLNVEPIEIQSSTAFTITSQNEKTRELAPEASFDVQVTYSPESSADMGQAVVKSDDAQNAVIAVELLGGEAYPDLVVSPSSVDFGNVTPGDTEILIVELENVGGAPLEISNISQPLLPFGVTYTLPIVLQPGEMTSIDVSAAPTDFGSFEDKVTIESNDPDGFVDVPLYASSASQPIAVCTVSPNPVSAIYDTATFNGAGSYDPQGLSITQYNWSFTSIPNGSAAVMPGTSSQATRRGFSPDVVGDYVAELIVVNSQGVRSEPCDVTLTAEASSDLWIEMFWQHSGDDQDLHLVAPGGSLVSNTDCYYGNCALGGLDWGVRGDQTDNPHLDLDDIPGVGPENINIESPQSGVFTVYVHDYPGSVYQPANDVTVNIYLGGVLVWTDTRTAVGEDVYAPYATIEWPSGVITPL